jgi:hypothetical protein
MAGGGGTASGTFPWLHCDDFGLSMTLLCLEAELGELLADVDKDTDDDERVRAVLCILEHGVDGQLGESGFLELDFGKLDFHLIFLVG